MKLAEALSLRADQQKRMEQLKERLLRVAQVQEGDPPAEAPVELLAEMERVAASLLDLVQRINRTNSRTDAGAHGTLADAIAARDNLRLRAAVYRSLADRASVTANRYGRSEIKYVSTVDVSATQRRADELAVAFRALDTEIQALNWTTELEE